MKKEEIESTSNIELTPEQKEILELKEAVTQLMKELNEKDQVNKALSDIIDSHEKDGMYSLFFAFNRKANEMAKSLNATKIDFGDKSFDRFINSTEKIQDLFKTLNGLRNDYLKITETEAEELEAKGIPLIEQRAARNKG